MDENDFSYSLTVSASILFAEGNAIDSRFLESLKSPNRPISIIVFLMDKQTYIYCNVPLISYMNVSFLFACLHVVLKQ